MGKGHGGADPSHAARTWLAVGVGYLLVSVAVWWDVWSRHPTSTTTCGCGDNSLFTWFLAWPAFAISHGLDPLHSTAMGYPGGVNLLSNTSELAIGTILAPVTWLFGPTATLNVALTLAPVLSSLAMFGLLRRWVSWTPAAVAAGLFYGFSPFIVSSLSGAYLMLGMAVVPPLIVACLDELLVTQRHPPFPTGVALGLLIALQFFIGTEVLVIVATLGLVGVLVVIVYAALRHPDALRARSGHAVSGLLIGGATAVVLLAYPVWFALAGPSHLSQPIWPGLDLHAIGTVLRNFFVPAPARVSALQQLVGGYQGPTLSNQYFGFGVAAVLIGGTITWRRDLRLWLFGSLALISAVLSLSVGSGSLLPWAWLDGLPLLENVIPTRFVLVTYLATAVMVGLIVDHARAAVAERAVAVQAVAVQAVAERGRAEPSSPSTAVRPGPSRRTWLGPTVATVVALLAIVPIVVYLTTGTPITTRPVAVPNWFRTVGPHLTGHQVLLVLPAPSSLRESAMTWQALNTFHYSMVGVGGPGGAPVRAGGEQLGLTTIDDVSFSFTAVTLGPQEVRAVRHALDAWGVTMVVIPDQPDLPVYDRIPSVTVGAALISAATGRTPIHQADAWVWGDVERAGPSVAPSAERFRQCTVGRADQGAPAVHEATSCVLANSSPVRLDGH